MSYTKLFKLIENDKRMTAFMSNVTSGCMDISFLMSETVKLLEDESIFCNLISDSNKIALCNMLSMYFQDCWELYIDDLKLDKLLKYGKIEVYKIDAANGLRYATVNEVAQGVRGLLGEYIYPSGEEAYKKLCLLEWTFSGKNYFYRQAGFELTYSKDGKVQENFYQMIHNSANELMELFKFVSMRDELDKVIKPIKKMQRSKGYKYASYEKDEVSEDITIKQLVVNVHSIFPRNSSNMEHRRALALSLKAFNNNNKLTPLEVSTLRELYDKYALELSKRTEIDLELKKICDKVEAERYNGAINSEHFAYTVIGTVKKSNYTKCSDRQLEIINDAYNQIMKNVKSDNKIDETVNQSPVISEDEIDKSLAMYDFGGNELFDDEDA